jgi:hypothetical protein
MTKFNDFDVAEFRRHAAEMRAAAEATDNPVAKAECLLAAREWDNFVAEVVRAGVARLAATR